MGAIFYQEKAIGRADLPESIHIGDVSAHVGKHQPSGVRRLGFFFEVIQIDGVVVDDIDQAMSHINRHGSYHTDSIITENYTLARRFLREVDSSSVMVNASTRFADGFEYGLGAEIGISTDKLHARGPVGLEGLTTLKYIVLGDGQTRA